MTTISDMTKRPEGVDELPPWLAVRYRSRKHIEALVEIGRVLRGVGMTWQSLHRVTEEPGAVTEWGEYASDVVLAMVQKLERVQPWEATSSAPSFMRTLRDLAGKDERVALSPRQVGWLGLLLARADEIERAPPVEATKNQPNEADTGNVVQLRPRGRAL